MNVGPIVIAGSPNVGKSVIFNTLTGAYATVSNYPGTTVEVSRGRLAGDERKIEVIDTPGMYSLMPVTEEERVARSILFRERPALLLHVTEARNIERMLPLTLQLIEAGFGVILVLNMMDEAEKGGWKVNEEKLAVRLGAPVVLAAATEGRGIDELREKIREQYGKTQGCLRPR